MIKKIEIHNLRLIFIVQIILVLLLGCGESSHTSMDLSSSADGAEEMDMQSSDSSEKGDSDDFEGNDIADIGVDVGQGDVPFDSVDSGPVQNEDVESPDSTDSATEDSGNDAQVDGTDGGTEDSAIADSGVEDSGLDVGKDSADTNSDSEDTGCEPIPFEPDSPTVEWSQFETPIFVVIQGSSRHRGQDVVVNPGQTQVLIGKFAYGMADKDLKGELVEIWMVLEPPCGDWVKIGEDITSYEDEHGTEYGIEDDGGRIFFEIPEEFKRPIGVYPITMLVKGDHSTAEFLLFVVSEESQAVVFDIDGTLTTSDWQLMQQLLIELFTGDYVPEMYVDAQKAVSAYADKGYGIIYLTGRPDWLMSITAEWLNQQGFPRGVRHLTDTESQVLPTEGGVGTYKYEFLQKLQTKSAVNVVRAYGNATTDIYAYEQAGIPKSETFIIGSNAGAENTVAIESYTAHLPEINAYPIATHPFP